MKLLLTFGSFEQIHGTSLFGLSSDGQGAASILTHPGRAAIPFGLRMALFPRLLLGDEEAYVGKGGGKGGGIPLG